MAQKDEVKKLKTIFAQYEYEDEYDDSYDSFQAVGDADGEVRECTHLADIDNLGIRV